MAAGCAAAPAGRAGIDAPAAEAAALPATPAAPADADAAAQAAAEGAVGAAEDAETDATTAASEEADDKAGTPPATEPPAAEPPVARMHAAPAYRDEFAVVLSDGLVELDPRKSFTADEAQIFTAVYEGLFAYNPQTLEPVAAVAESWDLSADKLVWTFHLRPDARYSNGDKVTAAHFRDAWLSLLDPAKQAPYSSLFDLIAGAKDYRLGKKTKASAVGVKAVNDRTLQVTLAAPAAFFPSVLCHHSFAPIHPSMLAKADWSAEPPITNGAFRIVKLASDRMELERSDLYWDVADVAFRKLTILYSDDGKDAASMWDSGAAQWIASGVDLDALGDRSGIQLNAMFATHYYYVRSAQAPWNDVRVRRALIGVLPWDQLREGYLLPAKTLIYPIPGYPALERTERYDPDAARAQLAKAGFARGIGLPELVIRITPSEDAARVAGLMKTAWETELGLEVRIDVVAFADYYAALKRGDYVVGSSTWIGDFADPYTFLQMWQADSNLNDAGYSDKRYEGLIEQSMSQEGAARWKTLSEAEAMLLNDGTVLPIAYTPALNVIDLDEVSGWYANPLDIHPFKNLAYAAFRALPGIALAAPAAALLR
jgi:peptide/nickel transport system substrate-binding protein/oligopeptide transport system substrate-binding protein